MTDFEQRNHFQQTSPDSHFVKNTFCTLAKENGRVTLTPEKLVINEEGHKRERIIRENGLFKSI